MVNSTPLLTGTTQQTTEKKPEVYEFDSLDMFRGMILFAIMILHAFSHLAIRDDYDLLFFIFKDVIGIFLTGPAFLFVAGVTNGIYAINNKDFKRKGSIRKIIVRGIFLLVVAIVNSRFTGSIDLFNMDILYILAVLALIFPILWDLTIPLTVLFMILVLIVTPILRKDKGFLNAWGGGLTEISFITNTLKIPFYDTPKGEYHWDYSLLSIYNGIVYKGMFPFFPYIYFALIGLIVAKQLESGTFEKYLKYYLIAGIILLPGGLLIAIFGAKYNYDAFTSYIGPYVAVPVSMSHLVSNTGANFLIFIICHKIFDSKKIENWFTNAIRKTGKYSLSCYLYHFMIIYAIEAIAAKLRGTISEFHHILSTHGAVILGIGIWIFLIFFCLPISLKFNEIGTLEHLIHSLQQIECCDSPSYDNIMINP